MTISYTDKTKLAIVEDGNTAWGEAIRENFRILELILKGYQFAENKGGHINLSFAYYGGNMAVNGAVVTVMDGAVELPDNVTSYVEADKTGTVTANQTGFTTGKVALFEVTTATGAISTVVDRRTWTHSVDFTELEQRIDAAAGATTALAENPEGHVETVGAVEFGHYSGVIAVGGTVGTIPAGTIAVVDDTTNYLEAGFDANGAPAIFTNTTGFTEVERIPLHIVTVTTGIISGVQDRRPYLFTNAKGIDTFIGLLDTPATFGTAGQLARVNSTGDGLEFADNTGADASKLQGKNVPEPTSAENGKVLVYNSTTGAMEWVEKGTSDTTIHGLSINAPVSTDDGKVLAYDDVNKIYKWVVGGGSVLSRAIAFYIDGVLTAESAAMSFISPAAMTITEVKLSVDTAPSGADLIIDININGVTAYTTQSNRPVILDGATSGTGPAPDVVSIAAGDKITLDIDQVGSTTAGENLAVSVICQS